MKAFAEVTKEKVIEYAPILEEAIENSLETIKEKITHFSAQDATKSDEDAK